MKHLFLAAAVAAALASLPAVANPAQTTPRGVEKQAKADRKMERAHTIRHGESLSKEPKLVREEDRADHRKPRKAKHRL